MGFCLGRVLGIPIWPTESHTSAPTPDVLVRRVMTASDNSQSVVNIVLPVFFVFFGVIVSISIYARVKQRRSKMHLAGSAPPYYLHHLDRRAGTTNDLPKYTPSAPIDTPPLVYTPTTCPAPVYMPDPWSYDGSSHSSGHWQGCSDTTSASPGFSSDSSSSSPGDSGSGGASS
ncbi:hypothetical protein AMATHDRAFT_66603 [Amanita thiersii Skay4041]|uniref:Uncharacterized protein n=1 Tax=Amanita thiersii Skay4041 TaxID=703135 RepID=A0A2A9NJI5_9AGAR|nr:hypothetical protein AMATHDRAFT_66603 [Amanita thiersii Skay4041]